MKTGLQKFHASISEEIFQISKNEHLKLFLYLALFIYVTKHSKKLSASLSIKIEISKVANTFKVTMLIEQSILMQITKTC